MKVCSYCRRNLVIKNVARDHKLLKYQAVCPYCGTRGPVKYSPVEAADAWDLISKP